MIYQNNSILKFIDYSSLKYGTFVIKRNKSIYNFFNLPLESYDSMLSENNRRVKDITLIDDEGGKYTCSFTQTRPSQPVWRIQYKNDFKDFLKKSISDWDNISQGVSSNHELIFTKGVVEGSYNVKINEYKISFDIGSTYKRSELHDIYGGNRENGISNCKDSPIIFIFSDPRKKNKLYVDEWKNEYFYYSGEGKEGDMEMTRGNKSVFNHINDNKQIHLFEKIETSQYTYKGRLQYKDLSYGESKDKNGDIRESFQFIFKKFNSDSIKKIPKKVYPRRKPKKNIKTSSTKEGKIVYKLHKKRERDSKYPNLKKEQHLSLYGHLSCEVCELNFFEKYGERSLNSKGYEYIECHHNIPLSEYESEQETNLSDLSLVCSNCHRMIHNKRPWLSVEELKEIIKN